MIVNCTMYIHTPSQTVTDVGLGSVCKTCPGLVKLSVSGCESITDLSLRKLGASCPELMLLEATGCSHFTDAGFKALATVSLCMSFRAYFTGTPHSLQLGCKLGTVWVHNWVILVGYIHS